MINVAHLFSPRHAARAVQALKAHRWTQLEYAGFLERVAARAAAREPAAPALAADTLKTLFSVLPQVSNPIVRRVCLDYLQSLGSTDARHACCAAFVSTECYEEACAFIDPASRTSHDLIAFGGAGEVYAAARAGSIPSPLWSRLFEAFVAADNYDAAKELWLRADRPAFNAVSETTLLRFVEQIGRYRDKPMLQRFLRGSGTHGELRLTSGGVAAGLNCFTDDAELVRLIQTHEPMLQATLLLQDGRFVSDALARRCAELLARLRADRARMTPLLGNLLLQGVYRQNTSRTVLHVYRFLESELRFEPDQGTAKILANAAYRLGNSKLLGYEIWKELSARGVPFDRGFYETMIVCQLVGSGCESALFFVSEMFRQQVPLRGHVQRLLFNKFERSGDSEHLLALFQHRRPASMHTSFDSARAEAESAPLGLDQARANLDAFRRGQNPDTDALVELQNMLAFDTRKAQQTLA